MKIDVLCNDGSPLGITHADINGFHGRIGLGGAELAIMTLMEGWAGIGHEVVFYNDPRQTGLSPFEQRRIADFDARADRDVLIVFRSPNPRVVSAGGLKVWLSTDQYSVGDFRHFSKFVNKIVTISPRHSEYFMSQYDIKDSICIDLPIRTWEYEKHIDKVPNRLLFSSVPHRGLDIVAKTFPKIKQSVPQASLTVTSDYRLWGNHSPDNAEFVRMFQGMEGVELLGAVPRSRLIEEQLKAQILHYPCTYDELMCLAVAESMIAGSLPITTDIGALKTTNMGVLIAGDARHPATQDVFVEKTVEYLSNPNLSSIQEDVRAKAVERFSLENILRQWDQKVFS